LRAIQCIPHRLELGIQGAALGTLEQEKTAFAAGSARFGRFPVEVRLLAVQLILKLLDAAGIRSAAVERTQLRFEARAGRILDGLLLRQRLWGKLLLRDNYGPRRQHKSRHDYEPAERRNHRNLEPLVNATRAAVRQTLPLDHDQSVSIPTRSVKLHQPPPFRVLAL
jgi:hypothetical protein